ncbi:unnamed protein product [Caenorhabditis angaria]|uniref:Uncharacterized protein n=1 Tax=Caenorhabditis angaria TaxID=860376 RepID=A0A9P1MW31_9PELO|nr:unnamed protein product [Caenorhabditis angaria]
MDEENNNMFEKIYKKQRERNDGNIETIYEASISRIIFNHEENWRKIAKNAHACSIDKHFSVTVSQIFRRCRCERIWMSSYICLFRNYL